MSDKQRFTATRRPRVCPACGKAKVVKIVYGLPTPDAAEDADAGRIILGGCCLTEIGPAWGCLACSANIYRVFPTRRG